jgi:hypothetical protein
MIASTLGKENRGSATIFFTSAVNSDDWVES